MGTALTKLAPRKVEISNISLPYDINVMGIPLHFLQSRMKYFCLIGFVKSIAHSGQLNELVQDGARAYLISDYISIAGNILLAKYTKSDPLDPWWSYTLQ